MDAAAVTAEQRGVMEEADDRDRCNPVLNAAVGARVAGCSAHAQLHCAASRLTPLAVDRAAQRVVRSSAVARRASASIVRGGVDLLSDHT